MAVAKLSGWVGGGPKRKKRTTIKNQEKKTEGEIKTELVHWFVRFCHLKKKETGVVENHGCRFYSLVSTRFLLHSPSSSTSFSLACPSDSTVSSDSSSGPIWEKKKETKSNHGNEIYGNISLHVNTLSSKRKQHIIVDVDVFILRNDWRKTAGRSFPWRIELKLDGVSVLVGFFDRLWSAGSLPWHFLLLLLSLDFFFCVVFFCFFLFFFYRTKTQLTFGDRWVVRVTGEAFDALRQNERMKIHL